MPSTNNKRIFLNTILLYFRMFIIMIITLYTVRLLLGVLGVVDFGIYNAVGGIVLMFSFLSVTLSSALQRFFAFEIGKKDALQLKKTFAISILLFTFLSVLVIILAETIGYWFLNHKMVIPIDRMEASRWLFHFSIFSFAITLFTVPFQALIIAHENLKVFAITGIIEAILKFFAAFFLASFPYDNLRVYALLVFLIAIIYSLIYIIVCLKKYNETSLRYSWDKEIIKSLVSYSSWNMVGASANILKIYGSNLLLNIFFGPVVNAARGIAFQVYSAINNFVANFYIAVRPQITKTYAANESENMLHLVYKSSRISYFLLLFISLPLLLETEFVLSLWLKNVPVGAVFFTKLLIINILVESVNNQLVAALQATGKIKLYQSVISTLFLMILPISYVFFYFGASPESTFYISIIISCLAFVPQIYIVKKVINMSIKEYYNQVLKKVILVSLVAFIVPTFISMYFHQGWGRFFLTSGFGVISLGISIFIVGLFNNEQIEVKNYIKSKTSKLKII